MTKGDTELGRRHFSLVLPGSQHSAGARELETLTTLAWMSGSNESKGSSGEASLWGFVGNRGSLAEPRGKGKQGKMPHDHCSWLTGSWTWSVQGPSGTAGVESRRHIFYQLYHSLTLLPWTSPLSFPDLCFAVCEMRFWI